MGSPETRISDSESFFCNILSESKSRMGEGRRRWSVTVWGSWWRGIWLFVCLWVLLCFIINPRVRKIRNEVSSYLGIFSRTLRFYYVARSPSSPLPPLFEGHQNL